MKGSVYTIGSPQYLSSKFGTDFRVELLLNDESDQVQNQIENLFNQELPSHSLIIRRPLSRLYSVPADSIAFSQLFRVMNRARALNFGINYYTCSMSSLERVFPRNCENVRARRK